MFVFQTNRGMGVKTQGFHGWNGQMLPQEPQREEEQEEEEEASQSDAAGCRPNWGRQETKKKPAGKWLTTFYR